MIAAALAVRPVLVGYPPTNLIVGASRYPCPLLIKTTLLTDPLTMNALACAPEPELLSITTTGGVR